MSLRGFSWLVENKLAGMAVPDCRPEDFEDLKELGIGAIVTLTEEPMPRKMVKESGVVYLHLPVPDFAPPLQDQVRRFLDFCEENLAQGRAVVVHCYAGVGRTGTMLSCYLVSKGKNPEEAIRLVREMRPGSIETVSQENAVYQFAEELRDRAGR